ARHPRAFHSAMADQDDAVFVDNNNTVESEFPDGAGDLTELFLRMPPGIARVGFQLSDGQMINVKITHLRLRFRDEVYHKYLIFCISNAISCRLGKGGVSPGS